MIKSHSLRNLLAVGAATGSRLVGTLVLYGLLARMLGPAKFGEFTFWYTIGIVLGALSDYGFGQQILIRLASDTPERIKAEAERILIAKFFLVFIFFFAAILGAIFEEFGTINMVWIIILLLACACATLIEFFGVMLRARAQYQNEALRSFFATFAASVGAAVIGYLSNNLFVACLVMLAVRLGVLYFQYHAAKLAVNFEWRLSSLFEITVPLKTLRSGLKFAADGGAVQLLTNMDVVIAKFLLSSESAGIYMAGNRLVQASLAGVPVLSNVFIPSLVAANKNGDTGGRKFLTWVILSISILTFVTFLFGANLIPTLLFGPGFLSLSNILPLLGVVVAFRYLSSIDGFKLSVKEQQGLRAITHFSLSVLTIVLTAIFWFFGSLSPFQLALVVSLVGAAQLVVYRILILRLR